MTNRKLHTRYRLVPKSITLNDHERPWRTLFQNACVFGAHHENVNEDRPILTVSGKNVAQWLSFLSSLHYKVYADIRGSSLERRRRTIVGLSKTSIFRLFSRFGFSLIAKYVTLNSHFTSNFHYYEQRFWKSFYIEEPIYRIFLLYHVTSRDVQKRTMIRRIFRIRERTADVSQAKSCGRKSCGRYIVGTLTN